MKIRVANEVKDIKSLCEDKDFDIYKIAYFMQFPLLHIYLSINDCDYLLHYTYGKDFPFNPPIVLVHRVNYTDLPTKFGQLNGLRECDILVKYPYLFSDDYSFAHTVRQFLLIFITENNK